jgi:hypothetical protein
MPLAGTREGIYFCTNQGFWVKSDAPGDLPCIGFAGGCEAIQSLYAGIDGGSWSDGVYVSSNHGVNWAVSWYWPFMTSVLANPSNDQVIFAADSGYGVIMTTNGGASWEEINSNLGDKRVRDLAMSRGDTLHLYAATCSGLYRYGPPTGGKEHTIVPPPGTLGISIPTIVYAGSSMLLRCAVPKTYRGKEIHLTIFDAAGRKQVRSSLSVTGPRMEVSVPVPGAGGIYFVTVEIERLMQSEKLVVFPQERE